MARGDRSLAVAAFARAVAIATAAVEVQALVPALTGSPGRSSMTTRSAALEAATAAVGHEATVHHAKALIALGWVRTVTGDRGGAVELAERAGQLARERGDHVALALALELAAEGEGDERRTPAARCSPTPARCGRRSAHRSACARIDVALAEITPGTDGVALAASAADTLDRLGAKREAAAGAGDRCLGLRRQGDRRDGQRPRRILRARRADCRCRRPAGSRRSRRDLFKMLAINRGRPIHREVLIERLWPGEFGDKASNRLSVALSSIRNAVDPGGGHARRPRGHRRPRKRRPQRRQCRGRRRPVPRRRDAWARLAPSGQPGARTRPAASRRSPLQRRCPRGAALRRLGLPLREEALAMYLSSPPCSPRRTRRAETTNRRPAATCA